MATSDVLLVSLHCFLGIQLFLCNLTPAAGAISLSYPEEYTNYLKPYTYRLYAHSKRNREPWMSLLTSAFLREAADHVGDHGYRGLRGKK